MVESHKHLRGGGLVAAAFISTTLSRVEIVLNNDLFVGRGCCLLVQVEIWIHYSTT